MKKFFFLLVASLFLFFVAGNVYALPAGLGFNGNLANDSTFGGNVVGDWNADYKGYTGGAWSGYYIMNVEDDVADETQLTDLAEKYLGSNSIDWAWAKVDGPSGTSGFLTTTTIGGYSGTWTLDSPYSLGFYAVKGGTDFALYYVYPYQDSGSWSTIHLLNPGGNQPDISHLGALAVPEPGTIFLLGAGLVGLVAVSRRKFRK